MRWRRPKPEWRWPAHLAAYVDVGPQLAVCIRVVISQMRADRAKGEVHVPNWMFDGAQNQLAPIARYMSTRHANAGLENFMLKGLVVLRESERP